jgi:hypothetical protein
MFIKSLHWLHWALFSASCNLYSIFTLSNSDVSSACPNEFLARQLEPSPKGGRRNGNRGIETQIRSKIGQSTLSSSSFQPLHIACVKVISRKKFTVIRASTALSPLTDRAVSGVDRAVDFDCAQSTESNRGLQTDRAVSGVDRAVSGVEPHHSISLGSFLTRNRLNTT